MNKYFNEKKTLFTDSVSVSSGQTVDLFHSPFFSIQNMFHHLIQVLVHLNSACP